MWQLRWKIQQLLLTFLVNTRPTCSGVQPSVGGDNYFDKLHSCYYLVLVIVNCRQHTASEEWEHSAQNATPHLILLGFVSRNESAWGGQNEESSRWLGDKLRLCEVRRLELVYTIWIIPRGPLGPTIWYTLTQNSIFMQTIFHPVRCLQYKVSRRLNPDIVNMVL